MANTVADQIRVRTEPSSNSERQTDLSSRGSGQPAAVTSQDRRPERWQRATRVHPVRVVAVVGPHRLLDVLETVARPGEGVRTRIDAVDGEVGDGDQAPSTTSCSGARPAGGVSIGVASSDGPMTAPSAAAKRVLGDHGQERCHMTFGWWGRGSVC